MAFSNIVSIESLDERFFQYDVDSSQEGRDRT